MLLLKLLQLYQNVMPDSTSNVESGYMVCHRLVAAYENQVKVKKTLFRYQCGNSSTDYLNRM